LELHRKLCQAEGRAERAEKLAAQAQAKLKALECSTSWRLTSPLRTILSGLRRRHGGRLEGAP
jgi:hypothetical protein